MKWLRRYVPAIGWLPSYPSSNLRADVTAGLTVAVMLIPQAMAYAMLAGLPPIIGLYASVLPLIVYALFSTSRQLAVGPVAMVSLLVASSVGKIAAPGTEAYVANAVALALLVGLVQLAMGVARLGFAVRFLAHPVVSGFTSAAALIIGFSQLKGILGVSLPRSHHIHVILAEAVRRMGEVNLPTLTIGLSSMAVLTLAKRYQPTFPAALGVVVLGTLAVWGLDLHSLGVRIVGDIPAGFPRPQLVDLASSRALLPAAIIISFVGFMESIAVAKIIAARHQYEVDPNQELIALGAANASGAFFGAYPVTGGFSRTAVNDQAGAKTALASVITAGVIALTLLFLTPLFHYLPVAVLAAVIIVAVSSLVDVREFRHLVAVKPRDAALLVVTLVATVVLGIEQGILLGVGVSLLLFIMRTTRPHVAILGKLPGRDGVYRNVERFPDAVTIPGLVILRIDATFYFANQDFLKELLRRLDTSATPLQGLIIDSSGINDVDSSAAATLADIARQYRERGIRLYFAQMKGPVYDVMRRTGLADDLGSTAFTFTIQEAVDHFLATRPAPETADIGSSSRQPESSCRRE